MYLIEFTSNQKVLIETLQLIGLFYQLTKSLTDSYISKRLTSNKFKDNFRRWLSIYCFKK